MGVEIIAEVAQGFEGNPKLTELLAKGAVSAGADAIKYQLVYADELCIRQYPYFDLFQSLEMPDDVWRSIISYVKDNGLRFYVDIYGDRSFANARDFGVDGVKISTTDFYNRPLIINAINTFPKVYLSIGGVEIDEVDELCKEIHGAEHVTLMYGFQSEPTPIEENNLARIPRLKERYPGISVGFMDHSLGGAKESFYLSLLALGQGITCLEKHITLDRSLEIEDYISALTPEEFKKFVSMIRTMEPAIGTGSFSLTAGEKRYKARAGKVVVANKDLGQGDAIREGDLSLKRVSTEGSLDCFRRFSDVLGKNLKGPVKQDAPITKELI